MKTLALLALVACAATDDDVTVGEVQQHMAVCADGPTTFGIDVSRFQGDIDWAKIAGADVKFAYIQISRSLTDIDAKFAYNWRRAKEVGILRGAYQRFQPGQDVIGQAQLFMQKLGTPQPGDLPPLLDVEDANGLTGPQIAAAVKKWIDYVEPKVGVKPIIYTGFYFWRDSVGGADFKDYPLWIANYGATCPLVPPTWTRWAVHQYSSTVTLPGITVNTVDVNKFNGTYADLQAMAIPEAPCDQMIDGTPGSLEGILDEASTCFRAGGDPMFIRSEDTGYGSSLKWTNATAATEAANFGKWRLRFAETAKYRVEAYTPAPWGASTKTVYQVRHGDTLSKVPIDQSAIDGWQTIGEFDFTDGAGQFVRLDDNTGEANTSNTKIVFDALRFTRVADATEPEPGPSEEPADDGGGCNTSRGSSWLLALLVLVFARRRR
jgi:GH25 family lysozyme M1 (1,4-beta-N-acetylmuramidase)